MQHALALARKGTGLASPNPLVGCVIVREGQIVGEGFHQYEWRDHAEIVALKSAGDKARGATLYVNLEPCNGCGVSAWGWQDAAWWTGQSPLITFDRDGAHTMRIQVGKDGVQLDQIVLSPAQFMAAPPGPVKNDTTIVPK